MKKFLQFVSVSGVVLGLVGTSASVSSVARGGDSKGKRPVIIVTPAPKTSKKDGVDQKNTGLSLTQKLLVALSVLAAAGAATHALADSSEETKKKVVEHYVSFKVISDAGWELMRWINVISQLLDTQSTERRAH